MIIALVTLSAQQLRHRRVAEDKLRELPRADGLTGLNNRRAFDEVVHEEWRRAQRNARPLSTLLIDMVISRASTTYTAIQQATTR